MAYTEDPTVNAVIERIVERSAAGMVKYGTSIHNNLDKTIYEWASEAQEEAYDFIIYLEKFKERLRANGLQGTV